MSKEAGAATESPTPFVIGLAGWLLLAALSQVLFLAHWPLYLYDVPIPRGIAVGVALARMGVYAALAWGLLHHRRDAWGGTILELFRSVIATIVAMNGQGEWVLTSALYPAGWAQGIATGALAVLLPINWLLSAGWKPTIRLDMLTMLGMRLLVITMVILAFGLRRRHAAFGVPEPEAAHWRAVVRDGISFPLALALLEFLAVMLARGAGAGA